MIRFVLFLLIAVGGLSACGGGGGGGGADNSNGGFASSTPNTKPTSSLSSSSASSIQISQSSKSSSSQGTNKPAIVIDTTAPSNPERFVADTTMAGRVVLSWLPATDNVGVEFYKIYRDQVQLDTVFATQNTFTDFDVAADKIYTYSISAGDNANNWSSPFTIKVATPKQSVTSSSKSSSSLSSSSSSVALIDKTNPSSPEQVMKINAFSGQVDIAWTPATDNVAVTSYRIYRNGTLLSTQNAELTTYSDKTVSASINYWYGISAGDAAGNWSEQKLINITTPEPVAKGNITLRWYPPTERENGTVLSADEIAGYKIRYRALSDSNYMYESVNKSQTQASLTNITGDYYFEIAVFDTAGLYSNYVNINPQ